MISDKNCKSYLKLDRSGIDPGLFYSNSNATLNFQSVNAPPPIFAMQSKLCGPSVLWVTFKKQQEALDYVTQSNLNLLPFTYQINDGTRLFLAAHPEHFWHKDEQKKSNERHAYEIILEDSPCKLYFDLEYELLANESSDGNQMVNTFIRMICTALHNVYGITCGFKDVLILDSCSPTKFSCHLIFQNVIFKNNYHAGSFVKDLCNEIRFMGLIPEFRLLKNVKPCDEIYKLTILDSKNTRKLFCDESVYTKNRHFRLFKSSKFGKNVPLEVSKNNSFKIEGMDVKSRELNTFLHSLITLCPPEAKQLTYECNAFSEPSRSLVPRNIRSDRKSSETAAENPFIDIDRCITDIVRPGSIYRKRYYSEKCILVYDIVGNRYCGNIGRQHKSNNIKYVVDVNTLSYYQRCHDPDCANFRSPSSRLPIDERIFVNRGIDDSKVLSAPENTSKPRGAYFPYRDAVFPSSEDEEDLIEAAEKCELLNRSRGKVLFFQDADDDLMIHAAEECEKSYMHDAENDQLMVSAAEECESLILNGKRKLSDYLTDDAKGPVQTKNQDENNERRKMICTDDLMIAMMDSCEKYLMLDEFR